MTYISHIILIHVNQLLIQGKMKLCLCIIVILSSVFTCTTIEIMPESKKIFLKFGYGINYKYEGTLSHSFDGFYVVTKFE